MSSHIVRLLQAGHKEPAALEGSFLVDKDHIIRDQMTKYLCKYCHKIVQANDQMQTPRTGSYESLPTSNSMLLQWEMMEESSLHCLSFLPKSRENTELFLSRWIFSSRMEGGVVVRILRQRGNLFIIDKAAFLILHLKLPWCIILEDVYLPLIIIKPV